MASCLLQYRYNAITAGVVEARPGREGPPTVVPPEEHMDIVQHELEKQNAKKRIKVKKRRGHGGVRCIPACDSTNTLGH